MGKKTADMSKPVDPFENGGLNEQDADATRPAFRHKPFVFTPEDRERVGEYHERDPRRRNNVCGSGTHSSFFTANLEVAVAGGDC